MNESVCLDRVRHWVETVVVGWNLCPFARKELLQDRIRFVVTEACDEESLLHALLDELELLEQSPEVETTVLIHPEVLSDFYDYNQFLDYVDGLIAQYEYEGIFQVASFHPHYQFAGTEPEDAENYTNRSPYPILHILREESLARAIERYHDVEGIPERNIALLKSKSEQEIEQAFFPKGDVDSEEKA